MELKINNFEEIEKFWGDRMPMMAIEELSELTQAISKCERHGDVAERKNLVDELGDVLISVMCIAKHYGISEDEIERRIEDKRNKNYNKVRRVAMKEELGISIKVYNAFLRAGYKIEDLPNLYEGDLRRIKGIGSKSVEELLVLKKRMVVK